MDSWLNDMETGELLVGRRGDIGVTGVAQQRFQRTAAAPFSIAAHFSRIGGIIVSSLDVPPLPLM